MRYPMFLITDDEYSALGSISVEGLRWIGRDTGGSVLFNVKNYHGAERACKRFGLFVSSAWYGVQSA